MPEKTLGACEVLRPKVSEKVKYALKSPVRAAGDVLAMPTHKNKVWRGKVYIGFLTKDQKLIAMIKKAVSDMFAGSNIEAYWTSDPNKADVRVDNIQGRGSYSYLGNDATRIDKGQHTVNFGWLDGNDSYEDAIGTIQHEFGHALLASGHMHQHPDRDYEYDDAACRREYGGPPNNWSWEKIVHNVIRVLPRNEVMGGYTRDTIMHYNVLNRIVKAAYRGAGTYLVQAPNRVTEHDRQHIYKVYGRKSDAKQERLQKLLKISGRLTKRIRQRQEKQKADVARRRKVNQEIREIRSS